MPSIARKLLICAAVDGLIIQPLATKGQRAQQPVKVKYGDATISSLPRDQPLETPKPNSSFEAFGIVGLFTVSRLSYLITVTGRQQVAQIRGFPVYVVTDVALTPCTSQADAELAIANTATKLRRASADKFVDDSDSESEVEGPSFSGGDDTEDPGALSDRETSENKDVSEVGGERSSIAEDVIKRRGSYGRFAQRWFSRKGWMMDQKRNMGLSNLVTDGPGSPTNKPKNGSPERELSEAVTQEGVDPPSTPSVGESLMPKLLRFAHIWLGTSRSFYFSYDVDLTRSVANRSSTTATTNLPLHQQADSTFFWNQNLMRPFQGTGNDSIILPLMQGFVGQRTFVVDRHPPQSDSQEDSMEMADMSPPPERNTEFFSPERASVDLRSSEKKFVITVISRRSTRRAGLRYLRRGIDDNGHAANFVETEQILSTPSWEPTSKIFSFVQVRGSIPIFFTQSPYSLKPIPVLQHSSEANYRAFKKHFELLGNTYGAMQLVNLVEKHGVEAIVGNEYEKMVQRFNEQKAEDSQPLAFEWFDFHSACRGMKFENVSLLLDTLGKEIEEASSTVEKGDQIERKQKGVLRTNCMDCLDRTNVCQSSFGKFMLDLQLRGEGFDMSAQLDQENSWFNTLWADNGDAISKQYASTAAMKGDYTRTKKRDYRGMVNDLGLSLTRFYNGMVNDYFSQAAIDFFLGNVSSMVFDEFEATMMSKDPGVSMSKMREQAIETSQKIVIEDDKEDFIGGWTLLSPNTSDTIKTSMFEEVVLLLTDTALYLCRFDWKLDKVSSFERVDLAHVVSIKVGTYITSAISPAETDESRNIGLVITYEPGKFDIKRTNTRSLSSTSGQSDQISGKDIFGEPTKAPAAVSGILNQAILNAIAGKPQSQSHPPRKIALKALYSRTAVSETKDVKKMTENEQINVIATEIERLVFLSQPIPGDSERKSIVEKGDIISLAEAKKSTGILEQWGHSIKKLVWA
ncbi:SacI homology domain-containing protein [Annulohypoxylon maeteangense]|uniref:SacI homology domain-containing protein n=1 Tax=Annulohypoxylon maeteangense TaxID=1927788 RepID=UPI0020077AB4|nr:SacI homology domain-containing protein [Annulohypoxylon maeteangense]KAI0885690.1 SacI homology domain-containing protein [Annulohypoxylon maeteangense]